MLSLLSVVAQVPVLACARAESASQVALVRGGAFRDWLNRYESLRRFTFDLIADRFSTVMQLIEELAFARISRRVAEFLLARVNEATGDAAILSVTHEEIASELGAVREVISRVLKRFERAGAIEVARGQVFVRDPVKLAGLAVDKS